MAWLRHAMGRAALITALSFALLFSRTVANGPPARGAGVSLGFCPGVRLLRRSDPGTPAAGVAVSPRLRDQRWEANPPLRPLPRLRRGAPAWAGAVGTGARGNSSVVGGQDEPRSHGVARIKVAKGLVQTVRCRQKATASGTGTLTGSNATTRGRISNPRSGGSKSARSHLPLMQNTSLWGGERGPIEAVVMGKIIIDEFVLRRLPDSQIVRTGLGGGSPQAAIGARLWGPRTGLVAPVGQGFAQEMLAPLEIAGVDTQGVARLRGYVTPHTQIRYEAESMIWTPGEGWDRWMELGREMLPIPYNYRNAGLLHVITEGAGGAEVDMVEEFMSQDKTTGHDSAVVKAEDHEANDSGPKEDTRFQPGWVGPSSPSAVREAKAKASEMKAKQAEAEAAAEAAATTTLSRGGRTVLSVEPVMHRVTEGTVESLRRITEKALVVSPDWETAVKISNMFSARSASVGAEATDGGSLEVSGCLLHPHLMGKYDVRKSGKYWGGRPVYIRHTIAAGGAQATYYIYHMTTPGCASRWFMGPEEGSAVACLYVESEAVSPDEINDPWQEFNSSSGLWVEAPDLQVSRGLPTITFNDTLSIARSFSTDRGRMIMSMKGREPGQVRAVEFDPRHLKMVVRTEELPSRSRHGSQHCKYSEDDDEDRNIEEAQVDPNEWRAQGKGDASEVGNTETVKMLERVLALEAVQHKQSRNVTKIAVGVAASDAEVQEGGFVPEASVRNGSTLEVDSEQGVMGFGSSTQEFVLRDFDGASLLQRLCASVGVSFAVEGSQAMPWEHVDKTLVLTEEVQDVWRAVVEDESGDIYYWNTVTDETSWERPPELLRVSTSRQIRQASISSIKGDVTIFDSVADKASALSAPSAPPKGKAKSRSRKKHGKLVEEAADGSAPLQGKGTQGEWEPSPEVVLDRCAEVLGIKDGVPGILAVRRGAAGSYVLDCLEPENLLMIPSVPVNVVDPTGAGNAYSAALGYNLALFLPHDERTRGEQVVRSACRATATGAAVVRCEGMPVISHDLKTWMQAQAMALEDEVRTMSLRPKSMVEGVEAALAPPPAQKNVSPGKRDKNQSKRRMGPKAGAGRKHEQGEEADKSESDTRGEAKTRGRGGGGRGGARKGKESAE